MIWLLPLEGARCEPIERAFVLVAGVVPGVECQYCSLNSLVLVMLSDDAKAQQINAFGYTLSSLLGTNLFASCTCMSRVLRSDRGIRLACLRTIMYETSCMCMLVSLSPFSFDSVKHFCSSLVYCTLLIATTGQR